jgi:hypothetical protein
MAQYAFTFTSGDTVTPTKLNDARTVSEIVDADISATAAIAGTKIAPNFGSQNVTTTGNATAAKLVPTGGSADGNGMYLPLAGAVAFSTNGQERMRINGTGDVFFGTTQNNSDVEGMTYVDNRLTIARDADLPLLLSRITNGGTLASFRCAANNVGSISVTTTGTTYNTSSDYRLKQNIEPMVGGLTKLVQLKPSAFEFKVEPGVKVDGFIAHEVQAVVPQAVTGEKDGEEMQGLDMSKLVPVLVAAVQELSAKVAALEAA